MELAGILEGQQLEEQTLMLGGQLGSASQGLWCRLRLAHT
jgi:hypothetical protein